MTVATLLTLIQILNGLGGATVALLTIQKDLEARGFHPDDLLPTEHLDAIKALLAPVGTWDATHAPE
jgi:hypothetical protein